MESPSAGSCGEVAGGVIASLTAACESCATGEESCSGVGDLLRVYWDRDVEDFASTSAAPSADEDMAVVCYSNVM